MFSKAGNLRLNGSPSFLFTQYKAPVELNVFLGPETSVRLLIFKAPADVAKDCKDVQKGGRGSVVSDYVI